MNSLPEAHLEFPPDRVRKLSPDQERRLGDFIAETRPFRPMSSFYKTEAVDAINAVYAQIGSPPPHIVWCQSPWQLMILPLMAQLRLMKVRTHRRNDLPSRSRDELLEEFEANLNQPLWLSAWSQLQTELSAEVELDLLCAAPDMVPPYSSATDMDSFLHTRSKIGCRVNSLLDNKWRNINRAVQRTNSNALDGKIIKNVDSLVTVEHLQRSRLRGFNILTGKLAADGGIGRWDLLSGLWTTSRPPFVRTPRLGTELVEQLGPDLSSRLIRFLLSNIGFNPPPPSQPMSWDSGPFAAQFDAVLNLSFFKSYWVGWAPDSFWNFVFPVSVFDTDFYDPGLVAELMPWLALKRNVIACAPYSKICFVCEPPEDFHVNENDRLHNLQGPAMRFADGYSLYVLNGVEVDEDIVNIPEVLTVQRIERETNIERRRTYIELYGLSKFMLDSDATLVASDDFGELYRKDIPNDEPIVVLKVLNSTPEPDGTFKDYFLRVPPDVQTPHEAVAWTFGLNKDEYDPSWQT